MKTHSCAGQGSEVNFTTLRLLHYPPLPTEEEVKLGQVRCGEHVDYGSITLLFQDTSGGLEVGNEMKRERELEGGFSFLF